MSKLDIIYQLNTEDTNQPKFILKLENHCLHLLNFHLLQNQRRQIDAKDLQISMLKCEHSFDFIENCQTRAGDEAFTSIYQCVKCNYRKCIS